MILLLLSCAPERLTPGTASCDPYWGNVPTTDVNGSLLYASELDYDKDGVPDACDCAPENPEVVGDRDGDGWFDVACTDPRFRLVGEPYYQDCDDHEPTTNPGPNPPVVEPWELPGVENCEETDGVLAAPWYALDGVDNDCNGDTDVVDMDLDGFANDEAPGGVDCADCDPTVNPGIDEWIIDDASECALLVNNGKDDDCRDGDLLDWDGDCHLWQEAVGTPPCFGGLPDTDSLGLRETCDGAPLAEPDCNDLDPGISPSALEYCDHLDQNCDLDPTDGFAAATTGELGAKVVYVNGANRDLAHMNGQTPATGYASIQAALDQIGSCPEVRIQPGRYQQSTGILLDPAGEGGIAVPWTIVKITAPEGDVDWFGDGDRALRVGLDATQALQVEGLTFAGAGRRGGLFVEGGSLELTDVNASDIVEEVGAVALVGGNAADVQGGTFTGNGAATSAAGGVRLGAATITVDSATFEDNVSGTYGGGLVLDGFATATVTGAAFLGNEATLQGGGLWAVGGSLTLTGARWADNQADGDGGGAYLVAGTLHLGDPTCGGVQEAADGGCLYALADTLTVQNLNVSGAHHARGDGGGAALFAPSLSLSGTTTLEGARADGDGGGLYLVGGNGPLTVSGLTVRDGSAGGDGGGAMVLGGTAATTLQDVTIERTSASGRGGALAVEGGTGGTTLQRVDVTCAGTTTASRGGGIWADGAAVTLEEASVSGCVASRGGGLYLGPSETVVVSGGLTVASNTAGTDGGGVYLDTQDFAATGTVELTGNVAGRDGGGMYAITSPTSTDVPATLPAFTIEDNHAYNADNNEDERSNGAGGGLYLRAGSWVIGTEGCSTPSQFSGNTAAYGGTLWAAGVDELDIVCFEADGASADHSPPNGSGGGFGFQNVGEASVRDAVLRDFTAWHHGGCLYADQTELYVGTRRAYESSYLGGEGEAYGSWTTADAVELTRCAADQEGGAVFASTSTLFLRNVEATANAAESRGHHLSVHDSDAHVFDTRFALGGATYPDDASATPPAYCGATDFECDAVSAVRLYSGALYLTDTVIEQNSDPNIGGALYASDRVVLFDSLIQGNENAWGVYTYGAAQIVLHSTTVSENAAGTYVSGGSRLMAGCSVVSDNAGYGLVVSEDSAIPVDALCFVVGDVSDGPSTYDDYLTGSAHVSMESGSWANADGSLRGYPDELCECVEGRAATACTGEPEPATTSTSVSVAGHSSAYLSTREIEDAVPVLYARAEDICNLGGCTFSCGPDTNPVGYTP